MNKKSQTQAPQAPKEENFFVEIIKFALLAAVIIIPFRILVAEPYIVQGASMSPTFETGHYLIIDKVSHRFNTLDRGDIAVFKYPNDPSKSFIKRVIGLPGETVKIENRETYVKQVGEDNFVKIDEPYIKNSLQSDTELVLGPEDYFVMGDNRGNSSDSRLWGPLSKELVKGEPILRLYPFSEASIQPGDHTIIITDNN